MKMMKKVLAALLACLIVMSMAACAAKSDQTAKPDTAQTDADQPVPNAEDTQTPNAEAGDAPVSNDEADLTSWILEPDTNMAGAVRFWIPFKGEQGMDAMIAAFNEVYPNITVELNTYNNNAEGNMAVNTSIMAGEVDVLASFEISQAYTRWQNGMYMDLTLLRTGVPTTINTIIRSTACRAVASLIMLRSTRPHGTKPDLAKFRLHGHGTNISQLVKP